MSKTDAISFWKVQCSSLHRSSEPDFYARKSEEHAALMTPEERSMTFLDLGCGAGELLEYLQHRVNVVVGLDYSDSMLDVGRQRLTGSSIKLFNTDVFDYIQTAPEAIWMTTGAINQFLDKQEMTRFLRLFKANQLANSLFLYDCVDPVRYAFLPFGLSYLHQPPSKRSYLRALLWPAFWRARRALACLKLALGFFDKFGVRLGQASMGYGATPSQWRAILEPLNLNVEIVSSMAYEYRFHVIVRK